MLNREDCPTLERWLGLFAPEFIQARADLLIVHGFSLFLSWQLGALAKTVVRAATLLERESSATYPEAELGTLRGCLAVLSAVGAYFSCDPSSAGIYGREALTLLPEAWSFVRGGGMLFKVLAMQADGQGEAAVRLLTEEYEGSDDRASTYALRLLQALCFIYYGQAEDLERMIQTAQTLVAAAERSKLHLLQSWGHYFIGLAHYQRNELPAARQSFTRLLDFKNTGNIGALRDGVQRLALIHQLADEQAEAWEMLQFLSQLDLEQTGREWDETSALRARLWLMRGDLASADRWADNFTAPVPDQPWIWQDPPHLIKARILITRGTAADLRAAQEILDALGAVAERNHNRRLQIEVMALRALALDAEGQASDARDALQAAVDLAQPGGFVRVFRRSRPAHRRGVQFPGLTGSQQRRHSCTRWRPGSPWWNLSPPASWKFWPCCASPSASKKSPAGFSFPILRYGATRPISTGSSASISARRRSPGPRRWGLYLAR